MYQCSGSVCFLSSRIRIRIGQRYGTEETHPGPYQNLRDPQRWFLAFSFKCPSNGIFLCCRRIKVRSDILLFYISSFFLSSTYLYMFVLYVLAFLICLHKFIKVIVSRRCSFFIFSSTANPLRELRINANYELHHPDKGLVVGGIFSNAADSFQKGGSAKQFSSSHVTFLPPMRLQGRSFQEGGWPGIDHKQWVLGIRRIINE
jgi:hypothetical protein